MDAPSDRPESAPANRLINPFALPSDTDARFALLVAAVIGSSIFIFHAIYNTVTALTGEYRRLVASCQPLLTRGTGDAFARNAAFASCLAPYNRATAAWIIVGVVLLLAVAFLAYWLYPSWKIRRDLLEPFTGDDDPELVDEVRQLAADAGLRVVPTILTTFDPSPSGLAFGHRGRGYLLLNAGLLFLFRRDRPAFRAIVLHELGHLRNGDVDKTFLSIGAALAFGLVALIPFVLSLIVDFVGSGDIGYDLAYVVNVFWRVVALSALVYLILASLLRTREYYADARASAVDHPDGALRRVLSGLVEPPPRFRGMGSLHPAPADRVAAVDDPRRLCHLGVGVAIATGVTATVGFPNLTMLFSLLLTGSGATFLAEIFAGLIFGALIAGVVGFAVWRSALTRVTGDDVRFDVRRTALGLGGGVILGELLSLVDYLNGTTLNLTQAPVLIFYLVWSAMLLGVLAIYLGWMRSSARIWLGAALAHPTPRPAYLAGLGVATWMFGLWLGALFLVHDFGVTLLGVESQSPGSIAPTLLLIGGVALTAFVALLIVGGVTTALFGYAARFWRVAPSEPATATPTWPWIDRSQSLRTEPKAGNL